MYKIYKITRTDDVDYDEYDSCIVVAQNEKEAFEISLENYFQNVYGKDTETTIEDLIAIEIKLDKSQAVLGSFNAG